MYRIVKWLEFDFIAEHLKCVKSFAGSIVPLVLTKECRVMSFYLHRLQISFAKVKISGA